MTSTICLDMLINECDVGMWLLLAHAKSLPDAHCSCFTNSKNIC